MSISLILTGNKTDFYTNFSPGIELNGDYEMALVNLETYYSFPNVDEKNNILYYTIDNGVNWLVLEIPVGSYELNQLNDEIFRIMKSRGHYNSAENKSYISIGANFATLKCIIQIPNVDYKLKFEGDKNYWKSIGF